MKLNRTAGWLGAVALLGLGAWGGGLALWSDRTQTGDEPLASVAAPPPVERRAVVTALGRLEPRDGLVRLAGPSEPSVVIAELLVDEGDVVEAGQVLARLDIFAVRQAALERQEAEFDNAKGELRRSLKLHKGSLVSDSKREQWELRVRVAGADLSRAQAELERTRVRAPDAGVIVKIHAREGERVGPDGILELGKIDEMFAVAEVYETDIGGIRLGQRASVRSPVFEDALGGAVEFINLKVGKMDVLGADPAAKTDARVVEVEIRLDDGRAVSGLTNLQVEVEFEP